MGSEQSNHEKRTTICRDLWACGVIMMVCALIPRFAHASVPVQPILISGGSVPNGDGTFSGFTPPAINDAGQVAFLAGITGTASNRTRSGIYLIDDGAITKVMRANDALPGGYYSIAPKDPYINASGQVLVYTGLATNPTINGYSNQGLYRVKNGITTQLVREGDAAPGGGTFDDFYDIQFNNLGQTSFYATMTSSGYTSGIFQADGGGVTSVARGGQAAPGGGTYGFAAFPDLNNLGEINFEASASSPSTGGIYVDHGTSANLIAAYDSTAPDGSLIYSFTRSFHNDHGQVAYGVISNGTYGTDQLSVYRYNADHTTTAIAEMGTTTPDGYTYQLVTAEDINNAGQVLYTAMVTAPGSTSWTNHLFMGDGTTTHTVLSLGQEAVDGLGTISGYSDVAFNDAGQIVFKVTLEGDDVPSYRTDALYAYDPGVGLIQLARTGDMIPIGDGTGRSISHIDFQAGGLNNNGQATASFNLAGALDGIYVLDILETALTGDFNGDGFVGQDDLNILLTYWGQTVSAGNPFRGDGNDDGFVGQDDLNLILSNWGEGSPANFTLVPEPGMGTLALLLGGLALSRRRKSRT